MKQQAISLISLALLMASCGAGSSDYDATGTFEATEVIVSAEQNGKIVRLDIEEGDTIRANAEVGLIDTVQLSLKARQIEAMRQVYASQRPETEKQLAATREQLAKARLELGRYSGLVEQGAANEKQVDDARSQVNVLEKQLTALQSQLDIQTGSLEAQMETADADANVVADQLSRCHVSSPISGTILEKYMEPGEYASVGMPLFKVADMSLMHLRAYVTTAQLGHLSLGQTVMVFADYGDGDRKEYEGRVEWISSKSEFTPKTILTDDERADLVYAVKIAVRGDAGIKIGMYGEVKF